MKRTALAAVIIAVLASSAATSLAFAQQPHRPPAEPIRSIVDYAAPPLTLRALFAEVKVVVRGRVISSSSQRYDLNNRTIPLTAHDFQIEEVFKLDPTVPKGASNITVIQHGGTIVDQNGKVITGADEIYKPGQELIAFLNVSPAVGGFTVAYGPAGGFLITNNEVLIPQRVQSYAEFDGHPSLPTATFAQMLRQFPPR